MKSLTFLIDTDWLVDWLSDTPPLLACMEVL